MIFDMLLRESILIARVSNVLQPDFLDFASPLPSLCLSLYLSFSLSLSLSSSLFFSVSFTVSGCLCLSLCLSLPSSLSLCLSRPQSLSFADYIKVNVVWRHLSNMACLVDVTILFKLSKKISMYKNWRLKSTNKFSYLRDFF